MQPHVNTVMLVLLILTVSLSSDVYAGRRKSGGSGGWFGGGGNKQNNNNIGGGGWFGTNKNQGGYGYNNKNNNYNYGGGKKSSSGMKTLKKAAVIGAVAYGGYQLGKLSGRFNNYGGGYDGGYGGGYGFNEWNRWREIDGFMCRNDNDCNWIDNRLYCQDYELDFRPSVRGQLFVFRRLNNTGRLFVFVKCVLLIRAFLMRK